MCRLRRKRRWGPARIGAEVGLASSTVHRILVAEGLNRLDRGDRASDRRPVQRYQKDRPGELVHVDVKKLGRIPPGGGWRAHGRQMGSTARRKNTRVGYDYIHSMVDDHSRLAYSEILPDEKGATCAGFIERAAEFFRDAGIKRIERVMTDNHWSYRNATAVADVIDGLGAKHKFIRPHCPWQNGKVERFNRTLQTEWAYRQPFTTNDERAAALAPWLHTYNHHRRHHALGGHPPISRCHQPHG